jgi:hypothetical protein
MGKVPQLVVNGNTVQDGCESHSGTKQGNELSQMLLFDVFMEMLHELRYKPLGALAQVWVACRIDA